MGDSADAGVSQAAPPARSGAPGSDGIAALGAARLCRPVRLTGLTSGAKPLTAERSPLDSEAMDCCAGIPGPAAPPGTAALGANDDTTGAPYATDVASWMTSGTS